MDKKSGEAKDSAQPKTRSPHVRSRERRHGLGKVYVKSNNRAPEEPEYGCALSILSTGRSTRIRNRESGMPASIAHCPLSGPPYKTKMITYIHRYKKEKRKRNNLHL